MPTKEDYTAALEFLDGLLKRKIYHFSGFGLTFSASAFSSSGATETRRDTVDLGGGLLVDRDLLGHEAG